MAARVVAFPQSLAARPLSTCPSGQVFVDAQAALENGTLQPGFSGSGQRLDLQKHGGVSSPCFHHLRWNSRITPLGSIRTGWLFRHSASASTWAPVGPTDGIDEAVEPNGALPEIQDGDSEVLIEVRDVYKSFGAKHILKGASFKIRHGEAVGIIGPSGTGKSTILRIMAGLLAPDKGEVYICGKKREGLVSDEENPALRIGLVFQSAALFDSLTVRENVGFMLYEHSGLPEEKIRELVTESLASVGLKGVEERLPSELSGGMKKRVALARAIISADGKRDREVVMYDEPTAGLDPIASTVVEDLIRSMHIYGQDAQGNPGMIPSYVVVTHQHSTIRRAVDKLLFLHNGKVVWQGSSDEFDKTDEPIVRQFAQGSLAGPIQY